MCENLDTICGSPEKRKEARGERKGDIFSL